MKGLFLLSALEGKISVGN